MGTKKKSTNARAKKATAPKAAPARTASVEDTIAKLDAAWQTAIAVLRSAILSSDRAVTEHLKWNAPSFCYAGDDRVTFRFPPRGGVQLIFHRGVKARDTRGFRFIDESGLIRWAATDRGVVSFSAPAELHAARPAVVKLVKAWMKATT